MKWAYQVEPVTEGLFSRPYVIDLLKRAETREKRGIRTIGRIDKPLTGDYDKAWVAEHSWHWPEYDCPFCGVPAGKDCIQAGGSKAKNTHSPRIRMALEGSLSQPQT